MKLTASFIYLKLLLTVIMLVACGSQESKKSEPELHFTYVDSTQYYADRKGSISMRATFDNNQPSGMAEGYKFQFRSITAEPDFLSSISIIAGGKRIFLEEGQIVLPDKGITLSLSLDDSKFIAALPSALLQFRHNNTSYIFTIELHQLKQFSPG